MKISEPSDKGEASPWTTETKKDQCKRVRGAATLWPYHPFPVLAQWCTERVEGAIASHLKGTEPAQTQPLGLLLQQLGTQTHPDRVVIATECRRNPSSHLVLVLAPPFPVPPPTKGIAASTHWGKMWLMITSDIALPPMALDTHRCHRNAHTQSYPFKTRLCNCFT